MTRYVNGFLFSKSKDRVALVEKQRPSWQKGKLNGIGGHIEEGETPEVAQRREFREETGVDVADWEHFATLQGPDFEVFFFRAFAPIEVLRELATTTDETIVVDFVDEILIGNRSFIRNLSWLIPMALHESHIPLTLLQPTWASADK